MPAPEDNPDLLDWLLSLPKEEADAMRNILTKMVRREEMEKKREEMEKKREEMENRERN